MKENDKAINFDRFYGSLAKCYFQYKETVGDNAVWALKDYRFFFENFFSMHESYTGYKHRPIPFTAIREFLGKLPELVVKCNGEDTVISMRPEDYMPMIRRYYTTVYTGDWSWGLFSFMGGRVRSSLWKAVEREKFLQKAVATPENGHDTIGEYEDKEEE